MDKKALKLPLGSSIWETIVNNFNITGGTLSLSLCQKLSKIYGDESINEITLVFYKNQLIEIEEGNTINKSYGLAIDIGTTTVAAYLYNLVSGEMMGIYSGLNGQVVEGADVITRIVACINEPDGLNKLQSEIIKTINQLVEQAVKDYNIDIQNIYAMTLCGNSAIQHLFLGLHPGKLGSLPFASVLKSDMIARAKQLNLNMNPEGIVHFLPLIGGFVGADTTAVLLSLLDEDSDEKRLIIDLGTNGEIVLGNKQKMLAASTAAGPALEGAGIKFGMRGTNGAIERVNLSNGKIELQVIMDEKPLGICGSGLIDAIAEMLKVGIINSSGKLLKKDEFLAKCEPKYRGLSDYLEIVDNISVFVLVPKDLSQSGEKIYISQKDIRVVQLAKGAIYTGCRLLLRNMGLKVKNLKNSYCSAFGNYIDTERVSISDFCLPLKVFPFPLGNAAGAGVQHYLLSEKFRKTRQL